MNNFCTLTTPQISKEEIKKQIEMQRKDFDEHLKVVKAEALSCLISFFRLIAGREINDDSIETIGKLTHTKINQLVSGCDDIFREPCYDGSCSGYCTIIGTKEYEFLNNFEFNVNHFNFLTDYNLPFIMRPVEGKEGYYIIEEV